MQDLLWYCLMILLYLVIDGVNIFQDRNKKGKGTSKTSESINLIQRSTEPLD